MGSFVKNSVLSLTLLAHLFMPGCKTSDIEREFEKPPQRIGIAQVVSKIVNEQDSFVVKGGEIDIGLTEVQELTKKHNLSIRIAQARFENAQHVYSRVQTQWWDPVIFSQTRTTRNTEFTTNTNGARLLLPDGSAITVFGENIIRKDPGEDEDHYTAQLGAQITVPIPFLNPAYYRRDAQQFKIELDIFKSENDYKSVVRSNVVSSVHRYIDAVSFARRIELLEEFKGRLAVARAHLSESEKEQIDVEIRNTQARIQETTNEYQKRLVQLKEQIGIPLDQPASLRNGIEFSHPDIKDIDLAQIVESDYTIVNLVVDLAYSHRLLKEAEHDTGFYPSLFGEYRHRLDGQEDYIVGFDISYQFGQSQREKEHEANIKRLGYAIKRRHRGLQTQATSIVQDLGSVSQLISSLEENVKKTQEVLTNAEDDLSRGSGNYDTIRQLQVDWRVSREQLIDNQVRGLKILYTLESLLGQLDD